ncbi:OLC1v1016821C1 [Oldenlandia corymbosa var. corymbosa]|uniref:OLC1v1016821C1 n=1 Tax=Oldenlandia corymbosa var. corymbosa TaxID=529605 RepID=A0AAV1E807_OLDCO|nr:OLC1v1016821C1 [Oldenlandia corymbosa var. corymbosa]
MDSLKAKKVTSDFRLKKCAKKEQPPDRISHLPNEILVHTLSFLTLEDAIETSVLSKRWRDLWLNVARLDFDSQKFWKGMADTVQPNSATVLESNRHENVEWVNKVVQSHKSVVWDVFRIRFFFS